MSERLSRPRFTAETLSYELAIQHQVALTALVGRIPEVIYQLEDILAEKKGDRQLYNKWKHSLVIIENDDPVAFVMGYERQAEGTDHYPENTLYISELAVADSHQGKGVGRSLLEQFFQKNNELGFLTLTGELNYSLQTNSAQWNSRVVELYESFGFTPRALKEYPNRTDVVLGVAAAQLKL